MQEALDHHFICFYTFKNFNKCCCWLSSGVQFGYKFIVFLLGSGEFSISVQWLE